MRKVFLTILIIFITTTSVFADMVLTGGVAIEKVPNSLYGEWRVSSKLVATNSPENFKEYSVDLWNLSRTDNVITLENPFTGAKSSIVVNRVEGNLIKFKKIGNYDGKILSDVVQLTLTKDRFSGENFLNLQTKLNGKVLKNAKATYKIYGRKIAGSNLQ
jgi:hypothetical protein